MKKNIISAIAIVIAVVISILIFAAIIPTNTDNSPLQKYRTEAVRVLEKYKDFDIDAEEAATRLDNLMDEVKAEQSNAKNHDEERRLSRLWQRLVSIHMKLYHHGSATGYEIDAAIKEIKGGK